MIDLSTLMVMIHQVGVVCLVCNVYKIRHTNVKLILLPFLFVFEVGHRPISEVVHYSDKV